MARSCCVEERGVFSTGGERRQWYCNVRPEMTWKKKFVGVGVDRFCCAHPGGAQPEKPCYAFLRSQDLHVTCGKDSGQITYRRNIDRFAVSEERSYLAFLTSQITKRTATSADAVYTTTLVDLRSGRLSQTAGQAFGDNTLVGTCGGIFRAADPETSTLALLTSLRVLRSICRHIGGLSAALTSGSYSATSGHLYEGRPPVLKVPALGKYDFYTYNISPDGSKIVYETGSRPLCVFVLPRPA